MGASSEAETLSRGGGFTARALGFWGGVAATCRETSEDLGSALGEIEGERGVGDRVPPALALPVKLALADADVLLAKMSSSLGRCIRLIGPTSCGDEN